MPIASSLRFRLLLGIAKQICFFVDSQALRINLPSRTSGPRLPVIAELSLAVRIASGGRSLAGWFVPAEGVTRASVLLIHGIGDRIVYCRRAQRRLAQSGIASLVFHYSGYPGSEGSTTPENLHSDVLATYAWLREQNPQLPITVFGFSLGSGLAAEVVGSLVPPPSGLILAGAFTSLRQAGGRIVRPARALRFLLPDVWRTCDNVTRLSVPILVIHSMGDSLFPVAMAEEIVRAARSSGTQVQQIVLEAGPHNAPYLEAPETYWAAVIAFVLQNTMSE